ncbi:hypothetical protein PtB15_9B539 [Puccinia triticina]|nr:hypothetical protein PtB15_9B539 [Puccinia triticina]
MVEEALKNRTAYSKLQGGDAEITKIINGLKLNKQTKATLSKLLFLSSYNSKPPDLQHP